MPFSPVSSLAHPKQPFLHNFSPTVCFQTCRAHCPLYQHVFWTDQSDTCLSATVGFSCLSKDCAMVCWWFHSFIPFLFQIVLQCTRVITRISKWNLFWLLFNLWDVQLKWIISFLLGIPLVWEITELTKPAGMITHKCFLLICNDRQILSIISRSWLSKRCSRQWHNRLDWTKAKIFCILYLKDRQINDSKGGQM